MTIQLTLDSLYQELLEYFGQRLESPTWAPGTQEVTGVLYGALQVRCGLNFATNALTAVIVLGAGRTLSGGADGPFVSAGDEGSARNVFAALDATVRLRLPDEYLATFDVPFDPDLHLYGQTLGPETTEKARSPEMPYPELNALVLEFFGSRLSFPTSDVPRREMTGLLYDAFPFTCGLDDGKMIFAAGIRLVDGRAVTRFLGTRTSMACDRESILDSLRLVDEYCRLRLPAKYREAFASAYGLAGHDPGTPDLADDSPVHLPEVGA